MTIKRLPMIGRGRSATGYDNGDHTVIRRHRDPGYGANDEADAMGRAATAGVPAPTVHDVDGPDLLMDRVEGRPRRPTPPDSWPSGTVRSTRPPVVIWVWCTTISTPAT